MSAAPAICLRREPAGAFEDSEAASISCCCSSVMSRKSDMSCDGCDAKTRGQRRHRAKEQPSSTTASQNESTLAHTLAAWPPPDQRKEKEPSVVIRNNDLSSSGSIGCFSCISFIHRWCRRLPGRPGDCRETMLHREQGSIRKKEMHGMIMCHAAFAITCLAAIVRESSHSPLQIQDHAQGKTREDRRESLTTTSGGVRKVFQHRLR